MFKFRPCCYYAWAPNTKHKDNARKFHSFEPEATHTYMFTTRLIFRGVAFTALRTAMNVAFSPRETARLNLAVGSGGSLGLWCGVSLGSVSLGGLSCGGLADEDNRGVVSLRNAGKACDREGSCCGIDGMGTTAGLDPASPPPMVPSLMTRLTIELSFSRRPKHATLCSTSASFLSVRPTTIWKRSRDSRISLGAVIRWFFQRSRVYTSSSAQGDPSSRELHSWSPLKFFSFFFVGGDNPVIF